MIKSGLMEMDNIGNFHFIQIKTHTGTRHIIDKARYVNIHASMPPDQLPFTSRLKHCFNMKNMELPKQNTKYPMQNAYIGHGMN